MGNVDTGSSGGKVGTSLSHWKHLRADECSQGITSVHLSRSSRTVSHARSQSIMQSSVHYETCWRERCLITLVWCCTGRTNGACWQTKIKQIIISNVCLLLVYFRHSCTAETMSSKIKSLFSFVICGRTDRQHNWNLTFWKKRWAIVEKGRFVH